MNIKDIIKSGFSVLIEKNKSTNERKLNAEIEKLLNNNAKGVRVFLYGKLPEKGRRRGSIECYDNGRHLTVTGIHIPETPKAIKRDQRVIDWFHRKYIAPPEAEDSPQMGGQGIS